MDDAAVPGTLLTNAKVSEAEDRDQKVLTFQNEYLWMYWAGPTTIYGSFFKGVIVQKKEPTGVQEEEDANIFVRPRNRHFAVKFVNIQRYLQERDGKNEDPYNEIRISRHILNVMEGSRAIIQRGIIVPMTVISNRLQPNIDDSSKFYFIISPFANNSDLYDNIVDNNLSGNLEAIRHLFRQMVQAIHFLHNELNIFHCDLSVENFVLDGADHNTSRIFVIDFGQAQIIENGQERIRHDGRCFGKVRKC